MEDEIIDIPDLSDELNYSFASLQILKLVKKEWKSLKKKILNNAEDLEESVLSFDKLLNYYYD